MKVGIALGIVAVALVVLLIATFHANEPGLFGKSRKPVPASPAVLEARAKAAHDVTRLFQDVDAYGVQAGLASYDTGTLDYCYRGRGNGSYNNRCRYVVVKYYGLDGDFRFAMTQLDSALVAQGWERYGGGLPYILTGYYDRWHGPDKPKPQNFPHQYLVSNIPDAHYRRGSIHLFVGYAETDPTGKPPRASFEEVALVMPEDLSYQEGHSVDTRALYPAILGKSRYVLSIRIMVDDYFVN